MMKDFAMEQLGNDIFTVGRIIQEKGFELSDDFCDWIMDRFEEYRPSPIEEIDAIDFVEELKAYKKELEGYSMPGYRFQVKRILQIMELDTKDWKTIYEKPEFDCSKNKFAFTQSEDFKDIMNNFEQVFGFPF